MVIECDFGSLVKVKLLSRPRKSRIRMTTLLAKRMNMAKAYISNFLIWQLADDKKARAF